MTLASSPGPEPTGAYQSPPQGPPPERFPPGTLLAGRYRVVAPLGKGGMGEVYRADDLALGQPVALKFLPAHLAADPGRLARFRQEVAAARRVAHPNVCRVYDIAEHQGQPFLTMEFIDGEDLSSVLKRLGRMTEEKGLEVARQLCSALAAVHDQGLLHRDIKPANVMLDGRGNVRLADFGLAAAAEGLSATEVRSGTPLYQAPEQYSGKEVTPRSDVYALGLVLYELFTGKPAFAGLRRDGPPPWPSSLVSGLSPAVEAAILRCLEPSPAGRPGSALEVLAALPGGDPLAAALAAGETPSPRMVADAGGEGRIAPWQGAAILAALALALAAFAALSSEVMVFAKAGGLPKPTEWLSGKAREALELAGHPEGADSAAGYDFDQHWFQWVQRTDRAPGRWGRLGKPPAAPLIFWYRESPRPLVPGLFYPYPGSVETTRITWLDPPRALPDMAGVRLAPNGRLLEFYAVPSEATPAGGRPPRWSAWFEKARLELSDFRPSTEHQWVPPVFVEQRFTWVPRSPENASLPVRVEAGTHRNRVVWFRATPIWMVPLQAGGGQDTQEEVSETESQGTGDQGSAVGVSFLYIPLVLAVLVLAPATLRSGQGDGRGAFLLGACVFALMMVVWAFETRHTFRLDPELKLFVLGTAAALYWAALTGFSYLVLEPFVRRWWPEAVISWNRLLMGRWADPLVGRDVAAGVLVGVLWLVCAELANQVPRWVGEPPPTPWWDWWVPNTQLPRLWVGNFLINLGYSFRYAFFYSLLLLLLLRVVLRRPWLAGAAFVALTSYSVAQEYGPSSPSLGWALIVVAQALVLATLVRFGVLAMVLANFTMNTLWFPMTLDPARDYFASGLVALGSVVGLALFGAYTAAGGQRLFEEGIFRDG